MAPTLVLTGPASVQGGSTYQLALALSDPGADTVSGWMIDWGDGSIEPMGASASSARHVYTRAGTFNVRASLTNEDGTFLSDPTPVVVSEPPAPGSTPQTAIDLGLMPPRGKKLLRDTLTAARRVLYYRFVTDTPIRLDTTLSGLKGNVDLELLDASTTRSSARPSRRRSERIIRVLPPGTYYLRVTLAPRRPRRRSSSACWRSCRRRRT